LARCEPADRDARLAGAAQAIEAQVGALHQGDIAAFTASDERFHFQLVSAAGNSVATGFYATLGDRQRRMTARAISANGARLAHFVPEHRRLLELAAAGAAADFSATLWSHLRDTHAALAPTF
jgi:DNA-binding GntR family transcriptional regulator